MLFQAPPFAFSLCDSLSSPPFPARPQRGARPARSPTRAPSAPCGRSAGAQPRGASTPAPPTSAEAPPPQHHLGPASPVPTPPRACAVPAPPVSRAGEGLGRAAAAGPGLLGAGSTGHPVPSRDPSVRALGPVGNGLSGGEGAFRWARGLSVGGRPVPALPCPFEVGAAEARRRVLDPWPDRDGGERASGLRRECQGAPWVLLLS